MKCETPARSAFSSREPAPIQKPIATERTCASRSELVLVCPEARERARELSPELDPDAFLARPREPVVIPVATADMAQPAASLPAAVLGYTFWRLAETARTALFALGGVVALALL